MRLEDPLKADPFPAQMLTRMIRQGHFNLFLMKENKKNKSSWSALSLAWELGYSIAVPLVALALAGRFLDKKLGTSPWLLLVGILVSIAISSYLVYKKTLDVMNKK